MRDERGFTLIELLTVLLISSMLLGLSVGPLRTFWLTQSLEGASDVIVGELRKQQEDSVSQSHPLVFGAGFTTGASGMTIYSFNPAGDTCSATVKALDSGIFNAQVRVASLAIGNDTAAPEYVRCQQAQPAERILFFYARGTSNGGTIVLEQPNLAKVRTLSVSGITGRVTRS